MYVVKLQYKDSGDCLYANKDLIHSSKELRKEDGPIKLDWFLLSLQQAKDIFKELISRNGNTNGWGAPITDLNYISIVELSNYEPKREYQVVDFREFK